MMNFNQHPLSLCRSIPDLPKLKKFWRLAGLWLFFMGTTVWAEALNEKSVADHWPQWRGPMSTGVSATADPPVEWSESKNIRWKLQLPGKGHSTPIVWDKTVYLTAAAPYGKERESVHNKAEGAHDNFPVSQNHRFLVIAVDREQGNVLWQTTVRKEFPHEGGHFTGSLASNSPVTDGSRIIAFFGSRGLYCLDMTGSILWQKGLGKLNTRHAHGEGSSPALHGNTVVINWDHQGDSFIAAFDKHSGKELWKVSRNEITSWSSPLIVGHQGKAQVIISATHRIRSYDLETGSLIWECGGLSRNVVATPVAAEGLVFAGNSYDHQAMLAIKLDGAKGDITGTDQVIWTTKRLTPYVPSPLLYHGSLYFLRHNQNVLSRLDAKTGDPGKGPFRMNGLRTIFGSPVAASGRIYITDREGMTLVVSNDKSPRRLALNRLNDHFSASAALVDNELYLRGEKYLYCIAEE